MTGPIFQVMSLQNLLIERFHLIVMSTLTRQASPCSVSDWLILKRATTNRKRHCRVTSSVRIFWIQSLMREREKILMMRVTWEVDQGSGARLKGLPKPSPFVCNCQLISYSDVLIRRLWVFEGHSPILVVNSSKVIVVSGDYSNSGKIVKNIYLKAVE